MALKNLSLLSISLILATHPLIAMDETDPVYGRTTRYEPIREDSIEGFHHTTSKTNEKLLGAITNLFTKKSNVKIVDIKANKAEYTSVSKIKKTNSDKKDSNNDISSEASHTDTSYSWRKSGSSGGSGSVGYFVGEAKGSGYSSHDNSSAQNNKRSTSSTYDRNKENVEIKNHFKEEISVTSSPSGVQSIYIEYRDTEDKPICCNIL